MAAFQYLCTMLETLLPPRYRVNQGLRGAAMACAVAQVVVSTFALVFRLAAFAREPAPGLPAEAATQIFLRYGDAGTMLTGPFMLFDFWLRPLNMVLGYFVFEGAVRFLGALVGHQVIGTVSLYAISGIHGWRDKVVLRRELGPLIVDEVVRCQNQQYDLKVYSCRPKLHWSSYMTIEFEGGFYQMIDEEPVAGPRRFVYYLRKNPTGRIVVKVDRYRIDDVLKPAPDKWAGTERVRDRVLPKRKRKPVPDEIVRGTERAGYDLKIYSYQAKPDWNYFVTIEFEGAQYQVLRHEDSGPEPRPFVYYLKKNPPNRPAAVIKKYSGL